MAMIRAGVKVSMVRVKVVMVGNNDRVRVSSGLQMPRSGQG